MSVLVHAALSLYSAAAGEGKVVFLRLRPFSGGNMRELPWSPAGTRGIGAAISMALKAARCQVRGDLSRPLIEVILRRYVHGEAGVVKHRVGRGA